MTMLAQDYLFPLEQGTEGATDEDPDPEHLKQQIREELLEHLRTVGLIRSAETQTDCVDPKELIRIAHAAQRTETRGRESQFIKLYGQELIRRHFANGSEIIPENVRPILCPVEPDTEESALFRLATSLWSVPVSRGYGRRLRYLVKDGSNGKLIGVFALTDPVFNLRARDEWIGWDANDKKRRLVNLMDAHVVGAVPPYSQLLGGKIVASLMTSQDVCDAFAAKYENTVGVISKKRKHAQLVLITVTSALGRSSMYNRLRLDPIMRFYRIGMTEGWGHFHVPTRIFQHMRTLLRLEGHKYTNGYKFGQGPNWRIRVVREVLPRVGLDANLLRHGIGREIYAAPMTDNWREFLKGTTATCIIQRPSARRIGYLAVKRWLIPRAARQLEYQSWTRDQTWELLSGVAEP